MERTFVSPVERHHLAGDGADDAFEHIDRLPIVTDDGALRIAVDRRAERCARLVGEVATAQARAIPTVASRTMETLFEELKRYVGWSREDEAALRALHPLAAPHFVRIAERLLRAHPRARRRARRRSSAASRRSATSRSRCRRGWTSCSPGPWDEAYYELRCRIGRVHVRIALPQHYMFGAMNVIRARAERAHRRRATRPAPRSCAAPRAARRQDPRPRAGHHAAHLPRGSARPAGAPASGWPPSASSSARSATSCATRSASSRRRVYILAQPRRQRRAREEARRRASASSSASPTRSSPTCST